MMGIDVKTVIATLIIVKLLNSNLATRGLLN